MRHSRATSSRAKRQPVASEAPADARAALARLQQLGDPADALFLQGYFRTGPGEYGEGDRFLGIRVPVLRRMVPQLDALPLAELDGLLQSEWHEARLLALLGLVRRYDRGGPVDRRAVYTFYLGRTRFINNWDLVDLSAPHIVGAHLADRSRAPLHRLARSKSVWERRIAILATHYLIRRGQVTETLALAERLRHDDHDLIHKAVGWMLREAWKRDAVVVEFVAAHCRELPRTMLRYAIEKQPEAVRQAYLKGEPPRVRA